MLEYAAPVGSDLLDYLVSIIESIQKKALKFILPTYDYAEAMNVTGLQSLSACRQQACIKFVGQAKNKIPLNNITSNRAEVVCHGYNRDFKIVDNGRLGRLDAYTRDLG